MITLPTDWLIDIKAPASELFTDLAPMIFLLVGIAIGFYIIDKIIFYFNK